MATILIVDDEPDSRELLARAAARGGHEVVLAENGWEALLALDRGPIDLVLLDLMMPGMDGPTFLDILRNDRRRQKIPVILVTALFDGALLNRARRSGVAETLVKAHFTPHDLWNAIERSLAAAHGAGAAVPHAPPAPGDPRLS